MRGVTPSELKGHSNVLIQTVYLGSGCKPPMVFYPNGYSPGAPIETSSPSFRPTKSGKPTSKPVSKPVKKPV